MEKTDSSETGLEKHLYEEGMIISKKCLELSCVIGQGMCHFLHLNPNNKVTSLIAYTGESGLVYRGYINHGSTKELIAVKTCKGKKSLSLIESME